MQAIIITAYHEFDQLKRLTELLSKKFVVFVHIDKKVKHRFFQSNEKVHVYSKYCVNWGSPNHLMAILYLIQEVLKYSDITYCHLISGDDWPTRNPDEIYEHFEGNTEIAMLCTKYSDMTKDWYKVCHGWQQYYHYLDFFNYKKLPDKIIVKLMLYAQICLRFNRYNKLPNIIGEDNDLAQGLVWGSYPRDSLEFCLNYHKSHPEFLSFLSKGQAPEEFFFQTILSNSEYFSKRIIQSNYRYMNWRKKHNSYPAILDESDFDAIRGNEYYFCRKIKAGISDELIRRLRA